MSQRCRKLRERATRRCSRQVGVPAITLTTHEKSGRRFVRALLFLLGEWCRRARPVARRVLCAALVVALRAPCVVPVVVPLARFAVPDAAPCRTSRYPGAVSLAWRVWGWFGLQPSNRQELPTKRQVQMPLRIQIKRVASRRQTRFGSELSSIFVFPVECLALDPAQPDRAGRGGPEGSANAMQKNWRSRASAYRLPRQGS